MIYRFGDFRLNPATRELHHNGELMPLPARAFDCLAYLVEHRDRAVGRDELISAVWGRVEISNALLGHTIVRVRRCFGDTGNDQHAVRTVPRFGYRWVLPVEEIADAAPLEDATSVPVSTSLPIETGELKSPAKWHRRSVVAAGLVIAVVAVIVLMLFWPPAKTTSDGAEPAPIAQPSVATFAMVLPADVNAPADWQWLRLGLMDVVAARLRTSMPTAPSETVVSLLRQRSDLDKTDLLHDPALASIAALRVQPRVRLDGSRWQVTLAAFSAQRTAEAEGAGDDAMSAARMAADALLAKLGSPLLANAPEPPSPALDDLMQRSGAAMLADQLEQARDIVAHASPELRSEPRAQLRLAQIALREGDYDAVERDLGPVLDRLDPSKDAALRARSMMTLAAAFVRRHQFERALDLYEEAIALREPARDHEVLGVAHLGRGGIFADQGKVDAAMSELSRARTELSGIGDNLGVASVDVNVGSLQLVRHRPADALPALKDAVQQFERLGAREGRAHALTQQAVAEGELLDAQAVLATSARAWPADAATNNIRMRWRLTLLRATALAGVTRFDEASVLLDRVERESDPRADAGVRALAHLQAADMARQRGDAAAVLERLDAATLAALDNTDPVGWTQAQILRADALRARNDAKAAGEIVASLRDKADNDTWQVMQADMAEGAQLAGTGKTAEALPKFESAMRAADALNVPDDIVEVGSRYLDALCTAGDWERARLISGRIGPWTERDGRAAAAQVRFFRAQHQEDAARRAEDAARRLAPAPAPLPAK
jgi:DNA-binding winged helix-turn-helix (wHTH) protein/tetratricopeptide (TPR) repeat protein